MSSYLDRMDNDDFNEWVTHTNGLYGLARLDQNLDLPNWLIEELAGIRHPSGKSVPMLAMLIVTALPEDKTWARFYPELQRQLVQWLKEHSKRTDADERLGNDEWRDRPQRERQVSRMIRLHNPRPTTTAELQLACRRASEHIP